MSTSGELRRFALAALSGWLAIGLAGCSSEGEHDAVFESVLPAAEVRAPGRAVLVVPPQGASTLYAEGGEYGLGRVNDASWTADGRLLVGDNLGLSLVNPATGKKVKRTRHHPYGLVVTPDAATYTTIAQETRLDILSPDLTTNRRLEVPASSVKTDQISNGEAEFGLAGGPFTLDGVTWVEWAINSEHESVTDHGVLRIDGDEFREVQRNEPVVGIYPSTDGAALLMLRQNNDEEVCGGCTLSQNLVELDPRTGEVAASYGMPPGYERYWRVNALDKVGDRVAVRFDIGSSDDDVEPFTWQTWVYDGEWAPLTEAGGTRTWWQDGGRLVETPAPHETNESSGSPYTLTWETSDGSEVVYAATGADCSRQGTNLCPRLEVPGSLLPPAGE